MKISEIYKKYNIMPSLALHQFRVAGVAFMICDHIKDVSLDKNKIIKACLLHDMGNIVKFKLEYFPEFLEPNGLSYWKKIQDEFIKKYGDEEHIATYEILREIGLDEDFIEFLDKIGFTQADKNKESDDFEIKIASYADMRVDPKNVVSLSSRFKNLRERYNKNGSVIIKNEDFLSETDKNFFEDAFFEIERQIFDKCDITPDDINNENVDFYKKDLEMLAI